MAGGGPSGSFCPQPPTIVHFLIQVKPPTNANPDLVERLRSDAPLNKPDPTTFYGAGPKGYTDYPVLADNVAA